MGKSALALQTATVQERSESSVKENKEPTKKRSHHLISADRLCWIQNIAGKLLRSMQIPAYEYDELVAAGYLGLVEATERYNPDCGTSFKAYAYLRIRGSIIDCIRHNSYLSRRGYHYAKAVQAAYDVRGETTFPSNRGDKAGDNSISLKKITEYVANGALAFQLSFSEEEHPIASESASSNAEELLQKKELRETLVKAVSALPEKEKLVLSEYYFEGKSFTEIAKEHEITRPWASKLHKKALTRLQNMLKDSEVCEY